MTSLLSPLSSLGARLRRVQPRMRRSPLGRVAEPIGVTIALMGRLNKLGFSIGAGIALWSHATGGGSLGLGLDIMTGTFLFGAALAALFGLLCLTLGIRPDLKVAGFKF